MRDAIARAVRVRFPSNAPSGKIYRVAVRDPRDEDEPQSERDVSALNTASPQRNFTMTLDERVRGLGGPPAYAVRKRRIEDLEMALVTALRELPKTDDGATAMYECWEDSLPGELKHQLHTLNELIARHNRYYPIEANLPVDVASGRLMDSGRPWSPLPAATWADLTVRSHQPAPRKRRGSQK